jgi:hypothetical protein
MRCVNGICVASLAATLLALFAVGGCGSSSRAPAGAAQASTNASAAGPVRLLRTASFTAGYDRGWTLSSRRSPLGAMRYQLSSTGAPVSLLGIPARGGIGITVDELPLSVLAGRGGSEAQLAATVGRLSPLALLPDFVGTPRGARELARDFAPHIAKLGGVAAAEETYTYSYAGRANVQVDVLSRHASRVVLIELDAEPQLAAASERALEKLTGGWRWL